MLVSFVTDNENPRRKSGVFGLYLSNAESLLLTFQFFYVYCIEELPMSFKAPDIKGPRFRKHTKAVIDKAFIDKFIKRFPEHASIKPDMFRTVIKNFHGEIVKALIENRDGIELPEGLGFLFIANCQKSKKENIDFKASTLAGRKILHQNWDSDNRLMKIIFSNAAVRYRLANKQIWAFRLVKANRKSVSVGYKRQWTKYHFIPNEKGIHTMFRKRVKSAKIADRKTEIPFEYDEFKMD